MTWPDTGPPDLPEEELKEFVLGVADGRVFTNLQIHSHEAAVESPGDEGLSERYTRDLVSVFLVLVCGNGVPAHYLEKCAVVWEWVDQALPRMVNGCPVFPSARFLNSGDWIRARKAIGKELKRRKEIEV